MLQIDPNKRLSLAKVLRDEWMRKGTNFTNTTILTHSSQSNRLTDNGWNEHVLQIMKNMSIDVEQAKQVRLLKCSCHGNDIVHRQSLIRNIVKLQQFITC